MLSILFLLLACSSMNQAPPPTDPSNTIAESLTVESGGDVYLGSSEEAALSATADIEPSGAQVRVEWRKVSGPGGVLFTDPDSLSTTAIFSAQGEYELEVEVRSGELTAQDMLTVFVGAGFARGQETDYPDHDFYEETRAFPGAEGFGANATGGRDGRIEFITNLNDSGPGSARAAFEASGERYIIPLVWGYVDLDSGGIDVRDGDFTYAGQFMPSGLGLAFRNTRTDRWDGPTEPSINLSGASNAILRYLKVYRGINSSHLEGSGDAITLTDSSNVIIDHSAFAFGNDENVNFHGDGTFDVTFQHSWSLEPLHYSTHEKTESDGMEHGAGFLSGYGATRITLNRTFFYLADIRAPRLTGAGVYDVVNTYDYNNRMPIDIDQLHTSQSDQDEAIRVNIVNTLREEGPYNRNKPWEYGMRIQQREPGTAIPSVYLEGNIHPYRPTDDDTSLSGQWAGVYQGENEPPIRLRERLDAPLVRTSSAPGAKEEILAWGGPSYVWRGRELVSVRDPLLENIVEHAKNGTGPSRARTGWGSGKDWEWPDLPEGGISESEFWEEHFGPWRDANHPGREWDENVDGYQVIEHFLNSWVPDFPSVSLD